MEYDGSEARFDPCEFQFHKITLDIPYSADSYQLVYVDSQMMRYEPPSSSGGTAKIGGHYIEWVNQLDEQIKANLRAAASAS